MFTECSKRPFVTEIVLLTILIRNEFIIFLVDRVVCQMHKLILLVDFLSVSFTCKTSQTFLMHINTQRLITSNAYINSQVKFVSVDKQRIRDVFTDNGSFIYVDVINIIYEIDAFTLTTVSWFYDPHIFLAFMLL
jgi:hypothetical protein